MKWAAIVVAAGHGTRLGRPKQLLELAGLPMVGWSIQAFATIPEIAEIVVATEPDSIAPIRELVERLAPGCSSHVVAGGASRQGSVYEGLSAVSSECAAVLVHDGARPLVHHDDVRAGMREVRAGRAAVLAVPAIDTMKTVDPQTLRVLGTLDRRTLWAAQTPQFAWAEDLRLAHARARSDGTEATDESGLLERCGIEVIVVRSTHENFKVTVPEDLARAETILLERVVAIRR